MKNIILFLAVLTITLGVMAETKLPPKIDVADIIAGPKVIVPPKDVLVPERIKEENIRKVEGGSGIGGGNIVSAFLSWIDEVGVIFREAKLLAEKYKDREDRIMAIRIWREAFLHAQAIAPRNVDNGASITYRSIERALNLVSILNVEQVIEGGPVTVRELNNILAIYRRSSDNVILVTRSLDRMLLTGRYTTTQDLELKDKVVKAVLFQLRAFIQLSSVNNDSDQLEGLAYLTLEVSNDLVQVPFPGKHTTLAEVLFNFSKKIKEQGASLGLLRIKNDLAPYIY